MYLFFLKFFWKGKDLSHYFLLSEYINLACSLVCWAFTWFHVSFCFHLPFICMLWVYFRVPLSSGDEKLPEQMERLLTASEKGAHWSRNITKKPPSPASPRDICRVIMLANDMHGYSKRGTIPVSCFTASPLLVTTLNRAQRSPAIKEEMHIIHPRAYKSNCTSMRVLTKFKKAVLNFCCRLWGLLGEFILLGNPAARTCAMCHPLATCTHLLLALTSSWIRLKEKLQVNSR